MKNITKYINRSFESDSGLTPEFAQFARDYKKTLKNELADFDIVAYNRGHFYISGFLEHKETKKLIYFSTSDVRGSSGWFDSVLIRTAQHIKDYTGGANNYTTLESMNIRCNKLVQE